MLRGDVGRSPRRALTLKAAEKGKGMSQSFQAPS
jgi:hypothetical protein